MHIDEISTALRISNHSQVSVPNDWAQGRTVYGGLSAALIFDQMQMVVNQHTEQSRPIRYLNLSFIGPLLTTEPFTVEVELLRSGHSATQLAAKIIQHEQVAVMGQACFGINRESKITIPNDCKHDMEVAKKANFIPQIPKVVPKFLRHFDINLQDARFPFMHSKKSHMHGWMRFKKSPDIFNDMHLIACIDAWPCTVLQQLKLPVPASTMSWCLEFPQSRVTIKPADWLAYQANTQHAQDGYVSSDAKVWNQSGELLALSRQTVGIFG